MVLLLFSAFYALLSGRWQIQFIEIELQIKMLQPPTSWYETHHTNYDDRSGHLSVYNFYLVFFLCESSIDSQRQTKEDLLFCFIFQIYCC